MKKIINYPCTFNKPFNNGKFSALSECNIRDFNKDYANAILSRYKNGVGANSDNIVLVKEVTNEAD